MLVRCCWEQCWTHRAILHNGISRHTVCLRTAVLRKSAEINAHVFLYTTWKVDGATPMYWFIMAPCKASPFGSGDRHLLSLRCNCSFSFAPLCHATLTQQSPFLVGKYPKENPFQSTTKNVSKTTKSANGRNKRGGFPTFVRIAPLLGGGFEHFLFSPQTLGKWSNLTSAYVSIGVGEKPHFEGFSSKKTMFVSRYLQGWKPPTSCTLTLFFPKLRNSHTSRYTSETPGRRVGVLQWRGRWRNDVTDWVGLNKLLGWIPFWRRKGDNRSMVDGSEIR